MFPTHRRLKGRKVRFAARRLGRRFEDWRAGRISFGEFDASVQGWINHVRYADTWALREKLLDDFVWGPADACLHAPPSLRDGGPVVSGT